MKIGDEVTVVKASYAFSIAHSTLGQIGVLIEDAHDSQPYFVIFDDGNTFWYFPEEIELAKASL